MSGASPLGKSNNQTTVRPDQLSGTGQVDIKELGVSKGVLVASGNVPPPPQADVNKLANSLTSFMSAGASQVDVEVTLVQVAVAMRDAEAATQQGKIKTDQEKQRGQATEKQAKLEEAERKMAEAKQKQESGSILDKIKLAFEWLGAIIAIATAAVLIATGAGAVVGAFLIAAAIAAVVMAVDSTVQVATGMGIAGNIQFAADKAQGLSDEDAKANAQKADMGFKIAMAVIAIVASLGAGFSNAFQAAGSAGAAAAKAGEKLTVVLTVAKDAFKEALKNTGELLPKVIQYSQAAATSVNEAGKNTVLGVKAGLNYQATNIQSDAKRLQASAKVDEASMKLLDDEIDSALQRLMAAGNRFSAILDDIVASMKDTGDTLSHARFTA